jgi:hypothetical protein
MGCERLVLIAGLLLLDCFGTAEFLTARPAGAQELIEQEMIEVVVRLRPDTARAFRNGAVARGVAGATEVAAVLDRFGAALQPQHPGISDPQLASYFTISGLSVAEAEQIAAALRELDAVEAAYIQPRASPA